MSNSDTIIVLTDRDKVRERPGMYIGNNDELGLATIVREIIDNAIDEYPQFPDKDKPIVITLHSDNSLTVRDHGRGISPYESKKNKGQIEERLAFTLIGAGGKMLKNRDQNGSKFAGGLNGTGAAATNFMSEYFDVTIWKDNKIFHDRFENGGIPVEQLIKGKLPSKKQTAPYETGTEITFKVDSTVMQTTIIDVDGLEQYFQQSAYLHPGMEILFKNERDGDEEYTKYYSENGLIDYMNALTRNEDDEQIPLLIKPFVVHGSDSEDVMGATVDMEATIAVAFSKDDSHVSEAFTNGIYNISGGTHVRGFSSGLLRLVRHYYDEFKVQINTKYKHQIETITKITKTDNIVGLIKSGDIMRRTYVIIDFKHSNPILAPQTKDSLLSKEAKGAVDKIFYDNAMRYLDKNVKEIQELIGYLILTLYERVKESDANVKIDKKEAALAISSKLAAARHTGRGKGAELILVEGDSAAGSLKENRDSDFQAILPLRGKVLNVEKATTAKALENVEISTMLAAMGAGYGPRYNDDALEYDKIIICTDADTDGDHIAVLLKTLFIKFTLDLILNGHLYRLETPLFVNTLRNGKEVYSYNDAEQEEFLKKNTGKITDVSRNKGLGELTKEQVIETILTPETRRLKQYTIEDLDELYSTTDQLMGSNVQNRQRIFTESE